MPVDQPEMLGAGRGECGACWACGACGACVLCGPTPIQLADWAATDLLLTLIYVAGYYD